MECETTDTSFLDGTHPMFMETQNAERPDGGWLNVQIGNWNVSYCDHRLDGYSYEAGSVYSGAHSAIKKIVR